ncbi:hypothetical protein [Streptomyces sp. NPDC005345]|uniref:hypothetical protein n=1 Tax=Streptomyces sp. NPDC005345 TaxID=3156877 RepID=UPI0033B59CA5
MGWISMERIRDPQDSHCGPLVHRPYPYLPEGDMKHWRSGDHGSDFRHRLSIERPPTGLGASLEYWLLKQPLRLNLTVVLELRAVGIWVELDASHVEVAPTSSKHRTIRAGTNLFRPGLYKVWYAADIEWPDGSLEVVGPQAWEFVVTMADC